MKNTNNNSIIIGSNVKINPKRLHGTDFNKGRVIERKGDIYNVVSKTGKNAWYEKEELELIDQ